MISYENHCAEENRWVKTKSAQAYVNKIESCFTACENNGKSTFDQMVTNEKWVRATWVKNMDPLNKNFSLDVCIARSAKDTTLHSDLELQQLPVKNPNTNWNNKPQNTWSSNNWNNSNASRRGSSTSNNWKPPKRKGDVDFTYKDEMCRKFKKGECKKKEHECPYAHKQWAQNEALKRKGKK